MKYRPHEGPTVGQRTAARGHITARPWDRDYADEQLRMICDYVQSNPWVRSLLGADVTVTVSANGNKVLRLEFKRDS